MFLNFFKPIVFIAVFENTLLLPGFFMYAEFHFIIILGTVKKNCLMLRTILWVYWPWICQSSNKKSWTFLRNVNAKILLSTYAGILQPMI